jgi:hypothetical protein
MNLPGHISIHFGKNIIRLISIMLKPILHCFIAYPLARKKIHEALYLFSKRCHIELTISGLANTRNGISYIICSPELQQMHASLQHAIKEHVKGKDKQELMPHITIQQKVTAFKAGLLYKSLSADFKSFVCKGTGFSTYIYDKRQWIHYADHDFNG